MANTFNDNYYEVTPEVQAYADLCTRNGAIPSEDYARYKVFRGLRDLNGNGVLTGLTEISKIQSSIEKDGQTQPCEGRLYYRGIDIRELVNGFIREGRYGFEETAYLLLFGMLPTQKELDDFKRILAGYRTLPTNFVRDIIMKASNSDMMNMLARSVLALHSYDTHANETDLSNVLRQCLQLIALFPTLSVYGYQAYNYYHQGTSLYIHNPLPELSTVENILYILRPDCQYTALEARLLDLALVLHAEHGGGNNSTFTIHVVTSSGTDTYSAVAAALSSLKGPKHGGANIKVVQMFEDIKRSVHDWEDEDEISRYLTALVNKEAFDRTGLIYGMGHAVYSLSDPRATIFKAYVEKLSEEKGRRKEYQLYSIVERLAPQIIAKERCIYKGVSANIDFYSGLVYSMLDLPLELYTPIFATSRIVGWSAHRMEELINAGKIIRPSYRSVSADQPYVPMDKRA
nr:citrate/2-methylcitrate synthase [bacterium]